MLERYFPIKVREAQVRFARVSLKSDVPPKLILKYQSDEIEKKVAGVAAELGFGPQIIEDNGKYRLEFHQPMKMFSCK